MSVLSGWRLCPRCGAELARGDAHVRCPACASVYWANSVPCVQGLLVRDGRVLLGRRTIEPRRGHWDLPGGVLDEGEDAVGGLRREFLEETGIAVDPVEWLGAFVDAYDDRFTICLTWIVSGDGDPRGADDIEELTWFAPDELPGELAFPTQLEALQLWASGSGPPLGSPRGTSVVRPYDPRWPGEFEREAGRIRQLLGDLLSEIEHVGSTAVPGLAAKPVVDIAIAYADEPVLAEARRRLLAAGYAGGEDVGAEGGVAFAKGPASARTHHLQLVAAGSEEWRNYLAFRDRLRRDAALRNRYAALKYELAVRFPHDRPAYLEGKRTLIEDALALPRDEHA